MSAKPQRVTCEAGWIGTVAVNVFGRDPEGRYRRRGWDPCRRTATHRFSSGCAHEHLMTWVVCARCALALLERWRADQQNARCIACHRIDGHICLVLASAEAGLEAAA